MYWKEYADALRKRDREAALTMIEKNTETMLLRSINAKDEHFLNEAFDTIGQFNSSCGNTLFKGAYKFVASLLVMVFMNS